jgi:hypothetical protein
MVALNFSNMNSEPTEASTGKQAYDYVPMGAIAHLLDPLNATLNIQGKGEIRSFASPKFIEIPDIRAEA